MQVVALPPTDSVRRSESMALVPAAGAGALNEVVPRAASTRHDPQRPASQTWTPRAQLTTPSRVPSSTPHSRTDQGSQPVVRPASEYPSGRGENDSPPRVGGSCPPEHAPS